MEEWRPIKDFENYHISNYGNVKNIVTNKILRNTDKDGYYCVALVNNKIRKGFKVHRLVAQQFIDNPENKSDVNHKDKNKHNNHINNLEWNTRKENNIHRSFGTKITTNKNKPIYRIDKETNDIIEKYNSIELAAEWAYNNELTKTVHNGRNAIGNVVTGLSKTAYGYLWELEKDIDNLESEIWKQITRNSKTYFVSNLGRFKNFFGIIIKNQKPSAGGYFVISIDGVTYRLHRVVAEEFIPNPENKQQVNHKDGNKLNNCVDNLEWVTNQENQIHKFQMGLGNSFTRKINQYDLELNYIKTFDSIAGASRILNIGKTNIQGVLTKYRKTAGGFIFKYVE